MMESDHDSFNDYKSSTGTVDKWVFVECLLCLKKL